MIDQIFHTHLVLQPHLIFAPDLPLVPADILVHEVPATVRTRFAFVVAILVKIGFTVRLAHPFPIITELVTVTTAHIVT